ncbi:hypothetical protein GSI_02021 [Ganoderma sinense ZZ0214-1]|uniref:Uncharacterized protein n=1 Tax=Ganoderma sinense ZZ0214-1 TaxID=1077348 RepID=A0A2G8SNE7_9APHY|nr:hypothetical protein GSI_02021 [Ganoderma sinense ZZ0214-1]
MASSLTSSSLSGASSLVLLLLRKSSTLPPKPPKPSMARLLANTIAQFLKNFYRSAPPHNSIDKHLVPVTHGGQETGRADKFPFAHFVFLVRNAPDSIRALPITAIESYQKGGENTGQVPHRYSIVTIQHHHGRSTYLKLQLRAVEHTHTSVLTAELADSHSALVRAQDRRLAALELTPPKPQPGGAVCRGPSLDALAELLDIIQQRAGRYDACSRNCLWLADLVLFGSAVKFREAWLGAEGRLWPDWPLRKYLRGEMDVLAASTQCFLSEHAPRWIAFAYGALGNVFGGFNMQREVEEVVGKWRGYMDAVPVPEDLPMDALPICDSPALGLTPGVFSLVRALVTRLFGTVLY